MELKLAISNPFIRARSDTWHVTFSMTSCVMCCRIRGPVAAGAAIRQSSGVWEGSPSWGGGSGEAVPGAAGGRCEGDDEGGKGQP